MEKISGTNQELGMFFIQMIHSKFELSDLNQLFFNVTRTSKDQKCKS